MIRNLVFLFLVVALAMSSCRKDFEYETASEALAFSRDTVYLDTVFTTIRSETYSVKVYNQEDKDVLIPQIYLEEGALSYYKINVDGQAGTAFENVPLRAKDSMYIFVEIAPQEDIPNQSLLDENLNFVTTQGTQSVKLISLVEEAEFYFPAPGETDVLLNTDTQWNSDTSKVIFGNLRVAQGATLTINQDSKVYFHKKSSLIIDSNSNLVVNGSLNHEAVFRGDRHDLRHDTLPANWEGIKLLPQSNAQINYAKLQGGFTGIEMYQSQLDITNTQIHTFVNVGIAAIQSEVQGANLLMNGCGEADIALFAGGDYVFSQCTLANYSELGIGNAYSVYLSDTFTDVFGNSVSGNFTQAIFGNCIFYNEGLNSFGYSGNIQYLIDHCLLKYTNTNGFDPTTSSYFQNCWYNENPDFTDVRASVNNLTPENTFVQAKGTTPYSSNYPLDYFGNNRPSLSTLGAIEY